MVDEDVSRFVDSVLENIDWDALYEDIWRRIWEEGLDMSESETFSSTFSSLND